MKPIFFASCLFGVIMVVVPVMMKIKIRKRRRPSAAQFRRKETFEEAFSEWVQKINGKRSNEKLKRYLKLAGNPCGLDVFRFRLVQFVFPVLIALGFYCFFAFISPNEPETFPVFLLAFGMFVLFMFPYFLLKSLANHRKKILMYEITRFSHRLVVNISDKVPIYYAVKRASRTTKQLKPFIDEMLAEWMTDQQSAIKKFGKDVGVNEIHPLVNTLLAATNATEEKIITLFQQQIRNIDTMRDYQIEKSIEISPLKVTFVIMIPFFVDVGLILVPWYRYMIDILHRAFNS